MYAHERLGTAIVHAKPQLESEHRLAPTGVHVRHGRIRGHPAACPPFRWIEDKEKPWSAREGSVGLCRSANTAPDDTAGRNGYKMTPTLPQHPRTREAISCRELGLPYRGKKFLSSSMAVTTMVTKSKESWSLQLPELSFPWISREVKTGIVFPRQALFASVSLNTPPPARPADNCDVARQLAAAAKEKQQAEEEEEEVEEEGQQKKRKGRGNKRPLQLGALRKVVRVKIANPHVRRLVSGAIAGAVSRTFVAPLETIRTHLMVGSCGADTMAGVFQWIMRTEGWAGLFRGNAVNVLRVAPSKAIEARYLLTITCSSKKILDQ
ncbi:hypothetical protein PR202_ga06841 [Eleusine coracana subsp. coracana]|uniref:Uncharacterized protein n=1 Tax=Eleusine coracana subsp. coracana TaxID=191504 RepID=A0AAV5BXR0_ELECO|nr:hypothetical protein PR202_ga06841 [Eleusine coracana subsp. coracana]